MNVKQITKTIAPKNTLHGFVLRDIAATTIVSAVTWTVAKGIATWIESQDDN